MRDLELKLHAHYASVQSLKIRNQCLEEPHFDQLWYTSYTDIVSKTGRKRGLRWAVNISLVDDISVADQRHNESTKSNNYIKYIAPNSQFTQ